MKNTSAVLVLCAATVACVNSTAPRTAVITVDSDTVVAGIATSETTDLLTFTVPFTIRNATRTSVLYYAFGIERQNGPSWENVWNPIGAGGGTIEIKPNDSLSLERQIGAVVRGSGAPVWESPTIEGTYRLSVAFRIADDEKRVMLSHSSPFVLVRR